jgi:hypothetical protein
VLFDRVNNVRSTIRALIIAVHETALYTWIEWKSDYMRKRSRWSRSRLKRYLMLLADSPALAIVLFRIRTARAIRIGHHDNGFFANLLAVLDILAHAPPNCRIVVDWTLKGTEKHFRYGKPGTNVWDLIFEPIVKDAHASVFKEVHIDGRLNPFFISTGRDLLSQSRKFQYMRELYGRIYHDNVHIRNQYIIQQVEVYRQRMNGHVCLGVHKRLGIPRVAANQLSSRMPTIGQIINAIELLARDYPKDKLLIYLATDESDCVTHFVTHFGPQVLFRPEVHRVYVGVGEEEVHTQEWGKVGLKDACDVLIDALLLADCDQVLHLSSNVTTCVGFLNVQTKMTHFDEIHGNAPRK